MHLLLAHSYCCTLCILHKLIIEKKKKKKRPSSGRVDIRDVHHTYNTRGEKKKKAHQVHSLVQALTLTLNQLANKTQRRASTLFGLMYLILGSTTNSLTSARARRITYEYLTSVDAGHHGASLSEG